MNQTNQRKEIKCPVCGSYDNAQGERAGLCLNCYCDQVVKRMFDNNEGECPTLIQISKTIEAQHGGCKL